jgi:phage baseplate assembly protein W
MASDIDRKTLLPIERPEAIRQAIENILRTRKGERVSHPTFGVSFQVKGGLAVAGLSSEAVRKECLDQLREYEPRIEVTELEPEFDGDQLRSVRISFKDILDGRADEIRIDYTAFNAG